MGTYIKRWVNLPYSVCSLVLRVDVGFLPFPPPAVCCTLQASKNFNMGGGFLNLFPFCLYLLEDYC